MTKTKTTKTTKTTPSMSRSVAILKPRASKAERKAANPRNELATHVAFQKAVTAGDQEAARLGIDEAGLAAAEKAEQAAIRKAGGAKALVAQRAAAKADPTGILAKVAAGDMTFTVGKPLMTAAQAKALVAAPKAVQAPKAAPAAVAPVAPKATAPKAAKPAAKRVVDAAVEAQLAPCSRCGRQNTNGRNCGSAAACNKRRAALGAAPAVTAAKRAPKAAAQAAPVAG